MPNPASEADSTAASTDVVPTGPTSRPSAPRDSGEPAARRVFYGTFGTVFLGSVLALGLFVIRWSYTPSIALFAIFTLLLFGGSFGLARQVTALAVRPRPLLALPAPSGRSRVALLYTTMNDVVPECLRSVRQDYPCEVYVLDDSSRPEAVRTVDEIAREKGFTVVRRPNRRGFKAGAVNDWLRSHGSRYDFFVLLDADSYLPPDWVREALRFAEHPSNESVAVFQGQINIWNLDTRFARTLAPMSRAGQYVWERGLANDLDAVFCYGHNVLVRRVALEPLGGLVEGYVSEDFATAVALSERGWKTRFVPLHSYEAVPENLRGFLKRQRKWTRGAMEFFDFVRPHRQLGRGQKLVLFETPLGHVTNLLWPVAMFLAVFGYASSPGGALTFLHSLVHNPVGTVWAVPVFRFLILLTVLTSVPTALVRYRARISWAESWRHRWLSGALAVVLQPYELRTMVGYLLTGFPEVPVTPKTEQQLSGREILRISSPTLALGAALITGIALENPLGGVFNLTWLAPMMLAPIILFSVEGPGPPSSTLPSTLPRVASCRRDDVPGVFAYLDRVRRDPSPRAGGKVPGLSLR